jgi:hypothetical protein
MSDDRFRVDHAAERAELADAVSGLTDGYGCRLADSDPLAPLARRIAAT